MEIRTAAKNLAFLLIMMTCNTSYAAEAVPIQNVTPQYITGLIQEMIDVNAGYMDKFHKKVSSEVLQEQAPNTTAVICSDSRVDINAINEIPVGDVFTIRNIGNQVQTAYGSVEYGVYHLHTPLLAIIGHSGCGAVKAAMQDYSGESERIRSELDSLSVNHDDTLNANIVHNVNDQVKLAVQDFKSKVDTGEVVVIGMVYDLHNDFKLGHGQLIIVNINNETDPQKITANPYLKGLKNVVVLPTTSHIKIAT